VIIQPEHHRGIPPGRGSQDSGAHSGHRRRWWRSVHSRRTKVPRSEVADDSDGTTTNRIERPGTESSRSAVSKACSNRRRRRNRAMPTFWRELSELRGRCAAQPLSASQVSVGAPAVRETSISSASGFNLRLINARSASCAHCGSGGVGKTDLSVALAEAAIQSGFGAYFMTAHDLVTT
jgi:hypothetical protein